MDAVYEGAVSRRGKKFSWAYWALSFLLGAGFLGGCGDDDEKEEEGVVDCCASDYPSCKADDECAEKGEVCVQGTCQECAKDTDCKLGLVCDANKCVFIECKRHTDCGVGKICVSQKCVEDSS